MTESILYTFVPSAIKAITLEAKAEEETSEVVNLDAKQATAVAAAALSIATLLNAPPGFIEFLLCLPWYQFTSLYATIGDTPPTMNGFSLPKLHLATPTAEERAQLVNCQLLNEKLLDCIMDFLYTNSTIDSTISNSTVLPPLMCLPKTVKYVLQNGAEAGALQQAVLVQLQGCTPLHCAAMRGNPVLVDVLLAAGASPLIKNELGQVAMELVPVCGSGSGSKSNINASSSTTTSGCRCTNQNVQEPPECLSSSARYKLIRKSLVTCTSSLWAWLNMLMLCLMCLFGFLGCPITLLRPEVEAQGHVCWEERKKKAQHKAHSTVLRLRTEAFKGKEELASALGKSYNNNLGSSPSINLGNNGIASSLEDGVDRNSIYSEKDYLEENNKKSGGGGDGGGGDSNHRCTNQTSASLSLSRGAASKAYSHFSSAVNIIKSIQLQQQRYVPSSTCSSSSSSTSPSSSSLIPEAHFLPKPEWPSIAINQLEIALIWAGLAESAFAKLEECGCSGCRATAGSAIQSAVKELMELLASGSSDGGGSGTANEIVLISSRYLATAVHAKAKFLLKTDVQQSPTRASIWRVQQCVTEWSRIAKFGFGVYTSILCPHDLGCESGDSGGGGGENIRGGGKNEENEEEMFPLEIECLDSWATSAAADVVLVESLLGSTLPVTQSLSEAVPSAVQYDSTTGGARLNRTVTKNHLLQLQNALKQAKEHASDHIITLVEGVAKAAAEEISAGERLRDLLVQRNSTNSSTSNATNTGPSAEQLAAAIDAASKYPSLQEEVAQVEAMRERWALRAAAQQQLDLAIESARSPAPSDIVITSVSSIEASILSLNEELFWKELNSRVGLVEAAIEAARQSSISVARAKKLLSDLQAQGAGVEAGKALEDALSGGRAGSAALKVRKITFILFFIFLFLLIQLINRTNIYHTD
jgi:hypothetical protein